MAEQIDELMVKLGLETDSKDFNEANQMFDQLQSRVLQLGAVIGTGFGLQSLTTDFIAHNRELADVAETYGTTEQFISALGFAIDQTGGSFDDAFGSVRRMADLVENVDWGEVGGDAFREGFDPMRIAEAESLADAYMLIAEGIQGMDHEAARRSLMGLGFSESEFNLLKQGPGQLGNLLEQGAALRPQTPEMGELAIELDQAMGRLQTAIGGVGDEISMALMDTGIAEALDSLTEWLAENRDEIGEFAEEAMPVIKDMAVALGVLVSLQAARAGLGVLRNIPLASAGLAGLVYASRQIDQEGPTSQQGHGRPIPLSPGRNPAQGFGGDDAIDLPQMISDWFSSEDATRQRIMNDLEASTGGPSPGFGGGTRMEFRIDARGSTSPMETERAARRGVEAVIGQLAENTLTDIRGNIA